MNSSTFSFKRSLFATVATLLILLGVALGSVELHLRHQAAQNVGADIYRQRVLQGTAPWAAIGDSHVANGLVTTEWLDNLGQASDNLDSMLGKLAIRKGRPGLKGVIIPADAQMFAFYRLTADQGKRLSDLREEHLSPILLLRPEHRQYLVSTMLAIAYNPDVLWRAPGDNVNREEAPMPDTPKWDKDAVMRAQLHTPVRDIRNLPAALNYRKIVEELTAQNIKVCIVAYPLSSAYRRAASGAPTFAEAHNFYVTVAAEAGARFFNATSIFPDSLFGDPDHLSPQGAVELTAQLQSECATVDRQ